MDILGEHDFFDIVVGWAQAWFVEWKATSQNQTVLARRERPLLGRGNRPVFRLVPPGVLTRAAHDPVDSLTAGKASSTA